MATSSQPTASSPSMRQKLSLQVEKDGIDRISDLPDSILCHILSFLQTTEAVATSILSSRWKTLWTFIPCIYLDENLWRRWHFRFSFPDIVSRVFAQHKVPNLRKFHILGDMTCKVSDVDRWVRASISPNLEEFYLSLSHSWGQMLELPCSIFSCKNLVVLKLDGEFHLNLPSSSFELPSLKILWLTTFGDNSYWRLLSCCPVLEDLFVYIFGFGGFEDKLEICVPMLKRLEVVFRMYKPRHADYVLEINAPALEYFTSIGDFLEVVLVEKLPNLVKADVSWPYVKCDHCTDKVLGLLGEFHNVKSLSLSNCTTKRFAYDHHNPPMFHNLVQLNYKLRSCDWHFLHYLLNLAPNLEVLVVNKSFCSHITPFKGLKDLSPHLTTFSFKGLKDLSPHLTSFDFIGFRGLKDELKFVRRILKNARALKKMTLRHIYNVEEKSRILNKVLSFSRRSVSCKISFE